MSPSLSATRRMFAVLIAMAAVSPPAFGAEAIAPATVPGDSATVRPMEVDHVPSDAGVLAWSYLGGAVLSGFSLLQAASNRNHAYWSGRKDPADLGILMIWPALSWLGPVSVTNQFSRHYSVFWLAPAVAGIATQLLTTGAYWFMAGDAATRSWTLIVGTVFLTPLVQVAAVAMVRTLRKRLPAGGFGVDAAKGIARTSVNVSPLRGTSGGRGAAVSVSLAF